MADQETVSRQSPHATSGPEGSDLRSVASKIEGLLDDDGHYNPNPEQISRGHPDYDPDTDPRESGTDRDERGRFKAQAAEETDEVEDTAVEDEQQEQPTGDESDADTDEGDTDETQTESAVDEAETDEAETEGEIQTLSQLAEALEVSPEELKESITHTFNAADEEVTVTLAELEKGYQKDADYRRQTGALADARRQAEQIYQTNMRAFEESNAITAQAMNVAEQILSAELQDPRLAQLRESDPAEWTARREEIGQRVNVLRAERQKAAQYYSTYQNQQRAQLKQRETEAIQSKMPDFGKTHVQLARGAMSSLGYAPEEISEVFDHRMVLGALELAGLRAEVQQLRELKSKAADTVKRVKKDVPKLQKPGKQMRKPKGGIKRDNVQRLRNRAAKSGKVEDAARVIESMMG